METLKRIDTTLELRNCPFCNGEDVNMGSTYLPENTEHKKADAYYVYCEDCDGMGGIEYTKEEAVKRWNGKIEGKGISREFNGGENIDLSQAKTSFDKIISIYDLPVSALSLKKSVIRKLKDGVGIKNLGQLTEQSGKDLLKARNFGSTSVGQVRKALKEDFNMELRS